VGDEGKSDDEGAKVRAKSRGRLAARRRSCIEGKSDNKGARFARGDRVRWYRNQLIVSRVVPFRELFEHASLSLCRVRQITGVRAARPRYNRNLGAYSRPFCNRNVIDGPCYIDTGMRALARDLSYLLSALDTPEAPEAPETPEMPEAPEAPRGRQVRICTHSAASLRTGGR